MRLLDSLPDSQQKEILVKLTVRWAEKESKNKKRRKSYE